MRDVKNIISMRNELLYHTQCIRNEIKSISKGRKINELPTQDKLVIGKMYGLVAHYEDQIKGIEFCLNETCKIDTYEWNRSFENIKELILKIEKEEQ